MLTTQPDSVGSLGTAGATYGSVATAEIVGVVGVPGIATSGPEESVLITVQTGMVEAGAMDTAGDGRHNLGAAVSASGAFKIWKSSVISTGPQAFVSQTFAGV